MSGITVELSELDADLWEAFKRGGAWVAHSEYMKVKAENVKLRELVRDYERCTMHANCSRCEYDGKLSTHCPLSPCFPDTDELRELGVEVDA